MVAMGLAADRLGGRGGKRLGGSSGVVVVGGSSSNVSASTGTLAVPVVTVRLTANRLGGRGSDRLGSHSVGGSTTRGASSLAVP